MLRQLRSFCRPEALTYLFVSAGRMADAVTFEWLLDVDRSLEFGDPSGVGLLLAGDFDAERIGEALESRGFSLAEIEGGARLAPL